MVRFQDRIDAGRQMARALAGYKDRADALVLALPRGGVPTGFEIARELNLPLDVFVVRKLGVPGQPELAMGAIATGGTVVLNDDVVHGFGIPSTVIDAVVTAERQEMERRDRAYRDGRPPPDVLGRTVILVDDGLATGSTMRAAVQALRLQQPARIVVAVPVASPQACGEMRALADDVVCLQTPESFLAVSLWYEDFAPTSDEEVRELLERAHHPEPARPEAHRENYANAGAANGSEH